MAESLNDNRLRLLAADFGRQRDPAFLYCPLLSAAIAGRDEGGMELIMRKALTHGVKAKTVDEIILQSHLFLGFPAMIEASRLFAQVRRSRYPRNHLPRPYDDRTCCRWNRQGLAKIKRIYGAMFPRLVSYINSFSPTILCWMINDGYGQVLSRAGASFKLRELSVVATLAVTGYENQFKAHVRGTLNHGVARGLIGETIENTRFFCPPVRVARALEILKSTHTS